MRGSTSQAKPGYSRTSADINVVDGQIQRLQSSRDMLHAAKTMVLGACHRIDLLANAQENYWRWYRLE
jgi:hypothetical protein